MIKQVRAAIISDAPHKQGWPVRIYDHIGSISFAGRLVAPCTRLLYDMRSVMVSGMDPFQAQNDGRCPVRLLQRRLRPYAYAYAFLFPLNDPTLLFVLHSSGHDPQNYRPTLVSAVLWSDLSRQSFELARRHPSLL